VGREPRARGAAAGERLPRAVTDDPLVLYLVVPRAATPPLAAALGGAVRATIACRDRFAEDERWAADFAAWRAQSFRKVTLKARPGQWRRLLAELDAVVVEGVAALPPRRRSHRERLLAQMQAHTEPADPLPPALDLPPAAAAFLLRAGHGMSAGKAMAQVAHAALMLPDDPQWRAAGHPCAFAEAGPAEWAAARAQPGAVVVRDAGFTEVAPGTETVVAWR
jgi:peptidyl-tRNA hydrolase